MRESYGNRYKGLGTYGTIGLEIVLSILFGFWAGQWADRRFGTTPWLSLLGFGFGVAAAVRAVIRTARDLQRETEAEDRRSLPRDHDSHDG